MCSGWSDEGLDVRYSTISAPRVAANRRGTVGVAWEADDGLRAVALRGAGAATPQIVAPAPTREGNYDELEAVSVDAAGGVTVIWARA